MNRFEPINPKKYEISPVPQEISYLGGEARVSNEVNIVVQAKLHEATMPAIVSMLAQHGFTHQQSIHPIEGQTNLYLLDEKSMQQDGGAYVASFYAESVSELNRIEGYTLIVNGDATSNWAIVGCDRDGIHHGAVTLERLMDQSDHKHLLNCVITDYPEIQYRGYIEGFYGYPWKHADRLDLMEFGGGQKLNTYIYAPKDDPYHRKSWRELYPEDKAQEIAELASAGHRHHINFVWTIHPGDTIDLTSEEDALAAIVKLEQLYALGVRQFGILFDDLVGIPYGMEQAQFINRIDREFVKVKGDIRPLLTVGTRYCEAWGPSMTEYFKPFVDTLHPDVEIMWTGAATMSNISKERFAAPMRVIDSSKQLSVWWNYPVNDYCDSKLLMGKIENLSSDLDNVNGFFSNPMNQPQASKQALFCIADHNWNTDAYNCERSFAASFRALAPEVAEELEIFAANSCYLNDDGCVSGRFLFDESWSIKEDIHQLISGFEHRLDIDEYADRLLNYFEKMENASVRIIQDCLNRQLVKEMKPFLDAFRYMAQAAQHVIRAIHTYQAGALIRMEQHLETASKCMLLMDSCKVHRLKDGAPYDFKVDVGTLVIKPFLTEMLVRVAVVAGTEQPFIAPVYERNNLALHSMGAVASASSFSEENASADKVIDGRINTGKWCSTDVRPHLTVDLQQLCTIRKYRIVNCGHPEAGETPLWNTKHIQILASDDGDHYTIIDEVADNESDSINRILEAGVTARYFRLQVIEPAQTSVDGSGHTRIYAFELFDETYPEPSEKVRTSEIEVDGDGTITVHHVKKGDVISLFRTLEDQTPLARSVKMVEDEGKVIFTGEVLKDGMDRVFVERTSLDHLPSVRTSKGIITI